MLIVYYRSATEFIRHTRHSVVVNWLTYLSAIRTASREYHLIVK